MNTFEIALRRVEMEANEATLSAIARPQNRDAFEYGRMCGVYGGLLRAIQIMRDVLADEDAANKEL